MRISRLSRLERALWLACRSEAVSVRIDAFPTILAGNMVHASCVAVGGRAALICGPSGSGKSALALQMVAIGASLIADDRTVLSLKGAEIQAQAPDTIRGRIEARGVGILHCPTETSAVLKLVVDMRSVETMRLPHERHADLLGQEIPVLQKLEAAHFPAALLIYLKHGRSE